MHREQDAAMDRLQAVAHVGQSAPDDDAHRIVEIRLTHLVFQIDVQNFASDFGHAEFFEVSCESYHIARPKQGCK